MMKNDHKRKMGNRTFAVAIALVTMGIRAHEQQRQQRIPDGTPER
jgi:hypothetical protein